MGESILTTEALFDSNGFTNFNFFGYPSSLNPPKTMIGSFGRPVLGGLNPSAPKIHAG
jgi:hypothetical protein